MYKYSNKSKQKLSECDERLQDIFNEVIKHVDCTIVTGFRSKAEQNEKYDMGLTKVKWPRSKHNKSPSIAVDVAPYPINWDDRERFTLFAGFVLGIAAMKGINIRWGGDWDKDFEVKDNSFDDLIHFEIIND
jgi:peptidoglycan L-alanyl-D-glutamate endopeptidase CwlK